MMNLHKEEDSKKYISDLEKAQKYLQERTCEKCIHVKTCSIPVVFGRGMVDFFSEVGSESDGDPHSKKSPIKVMDLAKICQFYSSRKELLDSEVELTE